VEALRKQTARAEYAAKVSAAHNGVWGGAYNELLNGTEVPFDALMARLEAAARNVGPPPPT
jgi:hypothetical protein